MPYALFQYNRHGSVSKYRTLIIYSFILYMLIAFFMVCLPLPDWESTIGNTWQDHLNLIPLKQIWLYWHDKVPSIAALQKYLVSTSLWQLLYNILLTVPFGIYLRYYFNLSLRRTVLHSFLLSLFYETSQITAFFGIYAGVPVHHILLMILFAAAASFGVTYLGMLLDSVNPKLVWEDALTALRENYNTFFCMAIALGIAAVIAGLGILLYALLSLPVALIGLIFILATLCFDYLIYKKCMRRGVENIIKNN